MRKPSTPWSRPLHLHLTFGARMRPNWKSHVQSATTQNESRTCRNQIPTTTIENAFKNEGKLSCTLQRRLIAAYDVVQMMQMKTPVTHRTITSHMELLQFCFASSISKGSRTAAWQRHMMRLDKEPGVTVKPCLPCRGAGFERRSLRISASSICLELRPLRPASVGAARYSIRPCRLSGAGTH